VADVYYSLNRIAFTLNDDGTRPQVELHVNEHQPMRFYTSPDGLGIMIEQFKTLAFEVAKRLSVRCGCAIQYGPL
jgi:hypothetical protein